MKSLLPNLIIVGSLLMSLAAFAEDNHVNDTVLYEGTLTFAENKQTVGFNQRLTVVSFDAAKSTYSVKAAMELPDGSIKEDTQTVPTTDVKSRAEMKLLMEKCESLGGKREPVSVSGGDFQTCAVEDGKGGKTWFADVPFNIVKLITVDENKNIMTLEISLYNFADGTGNAKR